MHQADKYENERHKTAEKQVHAPGSDTFKQQTPNKTPNRCANPPRNGIEKSLRSGVKSLGGVLIRIGNASDDEKRVIKPIEQLYEEHKQGIWCNHKQQKTQASHCQREK